MPCPPPPPAPPPPISLSLLEKVFLVLCYGELLSSTRYSLSTSLLFSRRERGREGPPPTPSLSSNLLLFSVYSPCVPKERELESERRSLLWSDAPALLTIHFLPSRPLLFPLTTISLSLSFPPSTPFSASAKRQPSRAVLDLSLLSFPSFPPLSPCGVSARQARGVFTYAHALLPFPPCALARRLGLWFLHVRLEPGAREYSREGIRDQSALAAARVAIAASVGLAQSTAHAHASASAAASQPTRLTTYARVLVPWDKG